MNIIYKIIAYFIYVLSLVIASSLYANTIELSDFGGRPTVDISINGSEPFPVIVDTGFKGGDLLLNFKKAQQLGLVAQGTQDVQNMGKGRVMKKTMWGPQTVTIGNHEIELEHVSSLNMKRKKKKDSPLGVISFWALSENAITLNMSKRELTTSDSLNLSESDLHTSKYTVDGMMLPSFDVSLNGKSYSAHIDTGSPAGLTLPLKMKDDFEFVEDPKVVGKARIPGYLADIWRGTIKGTLNIGGHTFKDPEVNFLAPVQWVNIGSKILNEFNVNIDQKNQLIQFSKI